MSPRIYPPTPPLHTPESERQMYRLFRESPELRDWTIIHSSSHLGEKVPREIDFLALVPNYGILCIEIKGGGFYVRKGQWHRWNDHQPIESPARQSEQAMYALQKELQQVHGAESDVGLTPAECCVVFPDSDWPDNARRPRPVVIDRCDIRQGQFYPRLVASALRMRPKTGKRSGLPPTTPAVLDQILEYLVPDFDMDPSPQPGQGQPWQPLPPHWRRSLCKQRHIAPPRLLA